MLYEYVGVIHVHSLFSDGSGEVKDIAGLADECNLDFLILTDHNTLRALNEGYEGFYGNTFLLVGCEINDKQNKNHYIALGIDKTFSTRLPAVEYVKQIKEAGGIGFIAHPHEKRDSMEEHPAYPWTAWESEDFTGIEIWNHMSEWMENLNEQNKYQSFLHPLKTIISPPTETLEVWDKINLTRKCIGIGGIDAHAHKVNLLGFFEVEVFPYKVLFKSIRTHILVNEKLMNENTLENKVLVKNTILKALSDGKCFVSNSYHGDATGFRFYADDNSKTYQMGDEVSLNNKLKLVVLLPKHNGVIKLIRNGELYDTIENSAAEFFIKEKGAYRIEVTLNGKAWIYSNHIRVKN